MKLDDDNLIKLRKVFLSGRITAEKIEQLLEKLIYLESMNNEPENLITLCASCHAKTLFKRENWIKYYKLKAIERKNKL